MSEEYCSLINWGLPTDVWTSIRLWNEINLNLPIIAYPSRALVITLAFYGFRVAHLFSFLWFFSPFVFVLRLVSNVVCFSGLSILGRPFGTLYRLFITVLSMILNLESWVVFNGSLLVLFDRYFHQWSVLVRLLYYFRFTLLIPNKNYFSYQILRLYRINYKSSQLLTRNNFNICS